MRNFILFLNVLQNGRRRTFWMFENHFRLHFWPFQIDRPFWMSEISLSIAILAISDRYRFLFFGGHLGCPKSTFDRISGHFRSICNYNFFLIFYKITAVDHISGHFRSILNFIFWGNFDKMAAVGHIGCPKFTFDRISGHFR